MKVKTFFISLLFFGFSYALVAQLKFDAEIRPRAEVRHGYKNLPDSGSIPAFFVSQRSRMGLSYKQEKYEVRLLMQDVRVWGDETSYSSTGVFGNNASIDLKEAWVNLVLTRSLSLKTGRQEMKYGDQRLIAGRNWNQNGLSYDALVVSYNDRFRLDAGASYNNDEENTFEAVYDTNKIKTFNFLYFHKEISGEFDVSALYIVSGHQKPTQAGVIYVKNTLGGDLTYTLNNTTFSGSGYYQFGKNNKGRNVSAYMFSIYLKQKIEKLTLTAGTDYLSGHDYSNTKAAYTDTDHRFDLLQGARHSYNGHMDYFSNLPKATQGAGLVDLFFKTTCTISKKINGQADYHYFMLQNKAIDPETTGIYDKYLGSEIDINLAYSPVKELNVSAGYSFFIPTNTMERIQKIKASTGAEFSQWAYVMLTFKPNFYPVEQSKESTF